MLRDFCYAGLGYFPLELYFDDGHSPTLLLVNKLELLVLYVFGSNKMLKSFLIKRGAKGYAATPKGL